MQCRFWRAGLPTLIVESRASRKGVWQPAPFGQGRREVVGGHQARRGGRILPAQDHGALGRVPEPDGREGRAGDRRPARSGGAQIVAETGDVKRFKSAASIVRYAGLNSGIDESGQFSAQGTPITKHGSPYLRRALWLAANRARQHDPRLRAFYEKKRREGKPHRVAVTAVAGKLCHVVYAVMRDREPYDPAK